MIRRNPRIVMSGIVLVAILIVFSVFTTGCTKEEEALQAIFMCWTSGDWEEAILTSDPIANIAQSDVVIEWDTLSHTFPYKDLYNGIIIFDDTIYVDSLEDFTIELTSDVGDCEGTITLPGATSIIDPDYNDTLPLGGTVTVTWHAAQDADYYGVYYDLDAYDSTGSWIVWNYDTVRYVTSTSHTIPGGVFDAPDAAYYSVYFEAYPFSGVMPVAGETGNMTGSVNGFLLGEGEGDWIGFWVGEPLKKATKAISTPKQTTEKDRINAYLEALGIEKVIQ